MSDFDPPPLHRSLCACGAEILTLYDPRIYARALSCDACQAKADAARERAARHAALERSIPPAYSWAQLEPGAIPAVPNEKAREGARRLAALPLLTVLGPAAAGKTSLCVALLRERMRTIGDGGLFVHAHRIETARRRYKLGQGDPPEIDAALQAPVLLIDDVGFGEPPSKGSPVAEIIQDRHADGKPTWITTGLGLDQALAQRAIAALYGDGPARRMFEFSRVIMLGRGGPAPSSPKLVSAPEPNGFDAAKRRAGDDS